MRDVGAMLVIVFLVALGILVIGYLAVGRRGTERPETRGSAFMEWVGLTILSLLIGVMILMPGVFVLLFIFGNAGATAGMALVGLFIVATPIVWALVVRRRLPRSAATRR